MAMRVKLIHNPAAGDDEQPTGDQLLDMIRTAGHQVDYQSAKENSWATTLEGVVDIVAVAGGDGMVGQVAKRLLGTRVPVAVLPIGTANNVATSLGLSGKPLTQLINGWPTARRVKLDVGIATGPWGSRYFIEGLGVGLFAETMRRLDGRSNIDLTYSTDAEEKLMSAIELLQHRLKRSRARELKITLDGRDLSGECILLEALNVGCIGPNLYLAPQADPSDGLLDVVLVGKGEAGQLERYLADCTEGKVCAADLIAHRGKHLRIDWEGYAVHIDDEAWPQSTSTERTEINVIEARLGADFVDLLLPP